MLIVLHYDKLMLFRFLPFIYIYYLYIIYKMSKNLRGYSGTQVQINLDEINANSVTATNGNFTNLSIGTYSITTLSVSDLVASGVVKFTGLTDNSSNQDLEILIRSPTDNRIYHVLNFTINPQSGLITAGTLKLLAVSNLPTGSASASYKMLFLHSTGNVYKTEGLEWNEVDDILKTPKLQLSNIVNPITNTDYPILIIDGDEIKKIDVTDMFYNKSNQSLTAHNIIASNEIYYKSQTLDQRFAPLGGGGAYVDLTTAQTIGGAKTFTDLLTASDLQISGDLSIDSIGSVVTDTTYPLLTWDNTNNAGNRQVRVDAFNLFYNTSTNILHSDKFAGDLTGDLIGQVTLTAVDDTSTNLNRIPFISTDGANTGLLKSNANFSYKPSDGLLYVPRLKLTDLQDDSGSTKNNNLILFRNNNNNVVGDASFNYIPADELLSVKNVTISNDLTVTNDLSVTGRTDLGSVLSIDGLTSTSTNTTYTLMLWDNTNTAGNRTVNIDAFNLFYNTQNNTLQSYRFAGEFQGDLTGEVTLTTLDDTNSGSSRIPFISTGTVTGLLKSDGNFLYRPSNSTLYATNFEGNFNITAQTKSDPTDYPVLFYDATGKDVCIDSDSSSFTYDPDGNRLKARNLDVADDITATNGDYTGYLQADTVILDTGSLFNHSTNQYMGIIGQYIINLDFNIGLWSDGHIRYQTSEYGGGHRFYIRNTATNTPYQKFRIDDTIICDAELFANNNMTLQAPTFSDNTNCRVTFLNSNSNTGQVVSNNLLFFNPNNETLRTTNLRATDLAEVLNLRVTGTTNNAEFAIDTVNNYGLYATCNDGFVFRMGPHWRLRIYEAPGTGTGTVQVYDDLQVDGSATIDGDITKNTATLSTVARNQNVLFHDNNANDKRIKESNVFYFNPADERLTVTNFTAVNVKITPTVPTGGTGFPLLMHNGSTNDVKKTDSTCKYDTIQQVFHVKNITMDTAGEMYYKGQTLDARFAGGSGGALPTNYTTVFSSRYNSSGPAWHMHNLTGQAGDDTDYNGTSTNTGRRFGHNNQIEWTTSNSLSGGDPKISSYGASITGFAGAINFVNGAGFGHGDTIKINDDDYDGWWMIHISLLYQNNSGNRDMPYIRLMKQVNNTGSYVEQPQVSQGVEYLRHQLGELSNLTIHGPIYFANSNDNFRIFTLFNEEAASSPPAWDNETTNYLGLGLNISLTFMGKSLNNETVTAL